VPFGRIDPTPQSLLIRSAGSVSDTARGGDRAVIGEVI
jgi:hypothetical protein